MEDIYYRLEVETDGYAGNFHREMAAYIFGVVEEGHSIAYYAFAKAGGAVFAETNNNYGGYQTLQGVSSGMSWAYDPETYEGSLFQFNDDDDHHIQGGWWSSCNGNNVEFRFNSQPTASQLAMVKSRAEDFIIGYKNQCSYGTTDLKTILGLSLRKITTIQTVQEIPIV